MECLLVKTARSLIAQLHNKRVLETPKGQILRIIIECQNNANTLTKYPGQPNRTKRNIQVIKGYTKDPPEKQDTCHHTHNVPVEMKKNDTYLTVCINTYIVCPLTFDQKAKRRKLVDMYLIFYSMIKGSKSALCSECHAALRKHISTIHCLQLTLAHKT